MIREELIIVLCIHRLEYYTAINKREVGLHLLIQKKTLKGGNTKGHNNQHKLNNFAVKICIRCIYTPTCKCIHIYLPL